MPTRQHFEAGQILLVDKPIGWTSFDIVNKLRSTLRIKKIGHAGSLDPLATGLLIVCTGKMTKQIESFMAQEKEYICTFVIGKTTPSFDLETDFDSQTPWEHLTETDIKNALLCFQGKISQVPPAFSAIKIKGKPAYLAARAGKDVELQPREVEIIHLEIVEINLPTVVCRVVCSKGTYIRSLVRDIGAKLGVGAYMSALRRTRIGAMSVENAITVKDFSALLSTDLVE